MGQPRPRHHRVCNHHTTPAGQEAHHHTGPDHDHILRLQPETTRLSPHFTSPTTPPPSSPSARSSPFHLQGALAATTLPDGTERETQHPPIAPFPATTRHPPILSTTPHHPPPEISFPAPVRHVLRGRKTGRPSLHPPSHPFANTLHPYRLRLHQSFALRFGNRAPAIPLPSFFDAAFLTDPTESLPPPGTPRFPPQNLLVISILPHYIHCWPATCEAHHRRHTRGEHPRTFHPHQILLLLLLPTASRLVRPNEA